MKTMVRGEGESLDLPDANVRIYNDFFGPREANRLFETLKTEIQWRQDSIKYNGRSVLLPRETAWYGDPERSYTFSGIHLHPSPWTETLQQIKRRIEKATETTFNSVLLNKYRDGNDSVSWHSDSEPELGVNPVIGSVSFGQTRSFVMKHTGSGETRIIALKHGSFLVMAGRTQHCWVHSVPKLQMVKGQPIGPRINLTFRTIIGVE